MTDMGILRVVAGVETHARRGAGGGGVAALHAARPRSKWRCRARNEELAPGAVRAADARLPCARQSEGHGSSSANTASAVGRSIAPSSQACQCLRRATSSFCQPRE